MKRFKLPKQTPYFIFIYLYFVFLIMYTLNEFMHCNLPLSLCCPVVMRVTIEPNSIKSDYPGYLRPYFILGDVQIVYFSKYYIFLDIYIYIYIYIYEYLISSFSVKQIVQGFNLGQ